MTDRFVVIPAAYVILRRNDHTDDSDHADRSVRSGEEVLLQLRQNTGYMDGFWASSAAGHIEADESVFEGAVRETEEELDVVIDAGNLHPICSMHRTQRDGFAGNERVDFFFSVTEWAGTPRAAEPHKVAELRWFRLDQLPENLVPHERAVLERIDDRDLPPIVSHGFGH